MITITFTPETPAQADIVAKLMSAYLGATPAADPETAAVEAAPAPAKKGKPKATTAAPAEPDSTSSAPAATSPATVSAPAPTATAAPHGDVGNDTPAATSTASPTASTAPSQGSTVTLEQVRAKLAALSQDGKAAAVKGIIAQFGVMKLTDVPADKYPKLMADAEALEAA